MGFMQRPEAAFESLYSRHVREVYGYALGVLGSPADAEDVTQTTFLNAYRAFQQGERPHKPRNWLFAIAHNVCRQRFRQAARRPREVELAEDVAGQEETDAPTAQDIARALQSLPFNQRSALVMRELEGRRQSEIAEALGVSVSAVETLLFRARRGVREQLESALTCGEAARAISRQLDGGSSRAERAALRAHLRSCEECSAFARKARAQRGALRRLRALPLPASLLSWAGGTGAATVAAPAVSGLGAKLLAGTVVVALAAGAGAGDRPLVPARAVKSAAAPARPAAAAVATPAVSAAGTAPGRANVAAKDRPRGHAKAPRGRAVGRAKAPRGRALARAKAPRGRALGRAKAPRTLGRAGPPGLVKPAPEGRVLGRSRPPSLVRPRANARAKGHHDLVGGFKPVRPPKAAGRPADAGQQGPR